MPEAAIPTAIADATDKQVPLAPRGQITDTDTLKMIMTLRDVDAIRMIMRKIITVTGTILILKIVNKMNEDGAMTKQFVKIITDQRELAEDFPMAIVTMNIRKTVMNMTVSEMRKDIMIGILNHATRKNIVAFQTDREGLLGIIVRMITAETMSRRRITEMSLPTDLVDVTLLQQMDVSNAELLAPTVH
jgi:hypothetical protein